MSLKIGIGYDVHKLVINRKLILGGELIPYKKGLYGHSDADVLVHAICDALLGAAKLGDIGKHFPDTDSKYKNANSISLLNCVGLMINQNFKIVDIDSVIICQNPKLSKYIDSFKRNIADSLSICKESVGIKATTTENLGFEGKGEGIAAQAVALLETK